MIPSVTIAKDRSADLITILMTSPLLTGYVTQRMDEINRSMKESGLPLLTRDEVIAKVGPASVLGLKTEFDDVLATINMSRKNHLLPEFSYSEFQARVAQLSSDDLFCKVER